MEIYSNIADFLSSPKRRKILIILFLFSALIIILMLNRSAPIANDSPRIMICEKCAYRQQLRGAEKLKCPKCGKEMGALWKCMICSYEFECFPSKSKGPYASEEAFRRAKIDACRCPNCNSEETFPVTSRNMPDKVPTPVK